MQTLADKNQESKSKAIVNAVSQNKIENMPTFQFTDNRPEAIQMWELQEMANSYTQKNSLQFVDSRERGMPSILQCKRAIIIGQETVDFDIALDKLMTIQENKKRKKRDEMRNLLRLYTFEKYNRPPKDDYELFNRVKKNEDLKREDIGYGILEELKKLQEIDQKALSLAYKHTKIDMPNIPVSYKYMESDDSIASLAIKTKKEQLEKWGYNTRAMFTTKGNGDYADEYREIAVYVNDTYSIEEYIEKSEYRQEDGKLDEEKILGERLSLFIHELSYHGTSRAYQRVMMGRYKRNSGMAGSGGDPNIPDHREMFLDEHREDRFRPFSKALESLIKEKKNKVALSMLNDWHNDMLQHIKEYTLGKKYLNSRIKSNQKRSIYTILTKEKETRKEASEWADGIKEEWENKIAYNKSNLEQPLKK